MSSQRVLSWVRSTLLTGHFLSFNSEEWELHSSEVVPGYLPRGTSVTPLGEIWVPRTASFPHLYQEPTTLSIPTLWPCAVSRELYKPTSLVSVKSEKTKARHSTCELRQCSPAGIPRVPTGLSVWGPFALLCWVGEGSFGDLETFQTDLLSFFFPPSQLVFPFKF